MKLLYLLASFFRIGLFSVGGGLAIIPFINEIADNSGGWLTRELVVNMLAVAQSLPGAIGANLSAYVGFAYAGIGGAYVAAVSLTLPAIIMIMFIARTLDAFKENITVKNLFSGFRPAATGLISAAGFGVISISLWNSAASAWYSHLLWKEALIFLALFFLIIKLNKHPVLYIIAAAGIGVIFRL